jgi:hypothetical protein
MKICCLLLGVYIARCLRVGIHLLTTDGSSCWCSCGLLDGSSGDGYLVLTKPLLGSTRLGMEYWNVTCISWSWGSSGQTELFWTRSYCQIGHSSRQCEHCKVENCCNFLSVITGMNIPGVAMQHLKALSCAWHYKGSSLLLSIPELLSIL